MVRVKEILMKRDGLDEEAAQAICDEALSEAQALAAENRLTLVALEEIIASNFGLEPDYVEDILEFL